jgi:hypothetical protein
MCADAGPKQAHTFLLHRPDGDGYALCGQGWLDVGENGKVVGGRPHAGDAEIFELIDQAFKKLNAAGREPKPFGSPGYEVQKSACYGDNRTGLRRTSPALANHFRRWT